MSTKYNRNLKRKIRRFWHEWGISKDEAVMFLEAVSLIVILFLLDIISAFFV